jgi:hypothetical protein
METSDMFDAYWYLGELKGRSMVNGTKTEESGSNPTGENMKGWG